MTIAFLPIEIDVQLPNETKLLEFCREFGVPNNSKDGYSNWWNVVPVYTRGPTEVWYDFVKSKEMIKYRNSPGKGPGHWANEINKVFPEIQYMLEQLPFKEMGVVSLLEQQVPVGYHTDNHEWEVNEDPTEVALELEPRRYNILMNKFEYKSFFVAESPGAEKIYPKITKERPCHVICDRYHAHGADYAGPGKIMLGVIGGVLDRPRHLEMIRKNLEKYRDEAVVFDTPPYNNKEIK